MDSLHEEWRAVKGLEGRYEVSNLGRARSLDRMVLCRNGVIKSLAGVMLKLIQRPHGYLVVTLQHPKTLYVHQVIAEAFLGPKPEGFEINHIDGNKANNYASNLEYVTRADNQQHALSLGLRTQGERHCQSGGSDDQVREAYNLVVGGMTIVEAARQVGLTKSILGPIIRGQKRKYLGLKPFRSQHKGGGGYHRRKSRAE